MSTRREFAKTAVGALFGISAIPAVGEKPVFRPCTPDFMTIPWAGPLRWVEITGWDMELPQAPPDITIAQKIALNDRFS